MIGILRKTTNLCQVSPAKVFKLAHAMILQENDPANRHLIRREFIAWILSANEISSTFFVGQSMKELDALQYGQVDDDEARRIANWLVSTLEIARELKTINGAEWPILLWAKTMIDQILEVAQVAFHRPYIPKHKVTTSLRFISAFCDSLAEKEICEGKVEEDDFLATFFERLKVIVPRIVNFVHQQMLEIVNSTVESADVRLYDDLLLKLPVDGDAELREIAQNMAENATSLLRVSKSALENYVGGTLLNASQNLGTSELKATNLPIVDSFLHLLERRLDNPADIPNETWRTLRDMHYLNLWKIADKYPEFLGSENKSETIDSILESLDLLNAESAKHAFKCLGNLLKDVVSETVVDTCDATVHSCFTKMLTALKEFLDDQFRSLFRVFIEVVFDETFLLSLNDSILEQHRNIFDEIVSLSETRVGLMPVLAKKCFHTWNRSAQIDPERTVRSMLRHSEMIRDMLLFGPVHFKFTRNIDDTLEYLVQRHKHPEAKEGHSDPFERHHLERTVPPAHAMTRVYATECIVSLAILNDSDPLPKPSPRDQFSPFFRRLSELLLNTDAANSRRRGAHFANSYLHRRSHRTWQALSVTQMALRDDEEYRKTLLNQCLTTLEGNLPVSVRFMVEWTIARILCIRLEEETMLKEDFLETYVNQILEPFKSSFNVLPNKRIGSTSSLVDVIVLVLNGLDRIKASGIRHYPRVFVNVVDALLPLLIPLTTSQHFITRAYALSALTSIWPLIRKNLSKKDFDRYRILETIVSFNENKDGLKKSGDYVQHLFVFKGFQPLEDFTLETLFSDLPRITEVTDEEWISPGKFEEPEGILRCKERNLIPVRNRASSTMSSCEALNVQIKTHHVIEETADEEETFDVQKKIIPTAPLIDSPFDLCDGKESREAKDRGLIVVATLVDKIPNLGGLCRYVICIGL